MDTLSQEIGARASVFLHQHTAPQLHYVMLAGGTATLPSLKDRVTDLTGFACMVVNLSRTWVSVPAVRGVTHAAGGPSYLHGVWPGGEVPPVILINLLPYRESASGGGAAFFVSLGVAAFHRRGIVVAIYLLPPLPTTEQQRRNQYISSEIPRLESQIRGHRQPQVRDRVLKARASAQWKICRPIAHTGAAAGTIWYA